MGSIDSCARGSSTNPLVTPNSFPHQPAFLLHASAGLVLRDDFSAALDTHSSSPGPGRTQTHTHRLLVVLHSSSPAARLSIPPHRVRELHVHCDRDPGRRAIPGCRASQPAPPRTRGCPHSLPRSPRRLWLPSHSYGFRGARPRPHRPASQGTISTWFPIDASAHCFSRQKE